MKREPEMKRKTKALTFGERCPRFWLPSEGRCGGGGGVRWLQAVDAAKSDPRYQSRDIYVNFSHVYVQVCPSRPHPRGCARLISCHLKKDEGCFVDIRESSQSQHTDSVEILGDFTKNPKKLGYIFTYRRIPSPLTHTSTNLEIPKALRTPEP